MVLAVLVLGAALLSATWSDTADSEPVAIYQIVNDSIPKPLDGLAGDPERGAGHRRRPRRELSRLSPRADSGRTVSR